MSHHERRRYFGPYGGRFVPEMLVPALAELEEAFFHFRRDAEFRNELDGLLRDYAGRPTPLYFAPNLSRAGGGCRIYLKMEGLAHTGAHKINNVLGQSLLARKMGKARLVAETGAGQHGLAVAAAAARFGLKARIFMGKTDMDRQFPNVFFMRRMGAEVISVLDGGRTLKDAVNAALKFWIENQADTHYLLGSALGPFPYPLMVRHFQSVIGREVKRQILKAEKRVPDVLVACVGGGSNSLGLFHPFLDRREVRCIGVEAGGRGSEPGEHAVRFGPNGRIGIVQGYKSVFLQDDDGQVLPTHSLSAGLDYAGISPELADLRRRGRVEFVSVRDGEALEGFELLARLEGIIPALESAHAAAYGLRLARTLPPERLMVINLSGRGDKDLFITARALEKEPWIDFLSREAGHVPTA
ncbi:MAG TPA: tryptophan synthase subunit beta [Candidatus Aminicenantes bacterium]|nr:tryptophan synthase subunit beta [Acidobacteriota bacterium]OQB57707.1 MAG: Tryptophan synthase beta chain [Candidatus Aminicenantes bacterium ADurb.Bin147]HNQ80870.1 tryptophan synthase subunit beta [Candidatus Aminicenantes bacterium]MDD8030135.1 tryptophan synthase subunit beta [Acidobacteriota bacterium]HNT31124.1 tryptophan synthase subunit beta [Candidatus Aminicenantes bacterium]